MDLRANRRLRKAGRLVRAQFRNGALILVYHRIWDPMQSPDGDRFRLCVSPQRFAEQVAILAGLGTPVALSTLAERLRNGRSVRGLICVTFDDGYLDNYQVAAPILRQHGLPATFFIVTGKMGQGFWWDRLTTIVYTMSDRPGPQAAEVEDIGLTIRLGDTSERAKQTLVARVYDRLKNLPEPETNRLLDGLEQLLGSEVKGLPRAMNWDELADLLTDELFEVGGHTVTHPRLAAQDSEVQRSELQGCQVKLSEFVGAPVTSLAYPFGARADVSKQTVSFARRAGFELACCTELDVVGRDSDPMRLPRFWVSDWSADQLEQRIRRWFRS